MEQRRDGGQRGSGRLGWRGHTDGGPCRSPRGGPNQSPYRAPHPVLPRGLHRGLGGGPHSGPRSGRYGGPNPGRFVRVLATAILLALIWSSAIPVAAVRAATPGPGAGNSQLPPDGAIPLPDDPGFPLQWGLRNDGQAIAGRPGLPGVDVGAPAAWVLSRGEGVRVAVIDTGIQIDHPDLQGAFWTNPAEAAGQPGRDDDGNGYVDDVYGYDFVHRDATVFDPADGEEHGTHVAGIIAARPGNGEGVAGLAPGVQIMVLKVFDAKGQSDSLMVAEAIRYARRMGARIVNMSWGAPGPADPVLCQAIAESPMLFVAAAGNEGNDLEVNPFYPASCDAPNLITVAAADNAGQLAVFSNFGQRSVDLAAPGWSILSTVPMTDERGANDPDLHPARREPGLGRGAYGWLSGTSMATPFVTATAALVASRYPWLTPVQLAQQVLATVQRLPTLEGWVATGGLVSARNAVWAEAVAAPPFRDVRPSAALYDEVLRAARLGLAQGYAIDRFGPDEPVTRHQFAKLLVAAVERATGRPLADRPADGSPPPDFPDVNEDDGNLGPYVRKAAAAGFIKGYSDGTFRPQQPIARIEAALMVARALGLGEAPNPFADVSGLLAGTAGAVFGAGIMKGVPVKVAGSQASVLYFYPQRPITRAEAAAVALRAYDALARTGP
ncbi:peptidase S8 and S53 subtilisin kexin sedolisin [Thermaerobacter marianensis DSM 12885]|uniref:Peptidase S8 and S53 subtilisin kexin sedolisin n=1 Tax=Thermaerobacter marianensis (strain ATCC 700841 / DSM 12885 / JCM 10246 / 7p75a) TaxID=644966 RepID=E6SI37_THEM7|nr:S8 family serine peptidase [Thermaerobacter marianensis]ADU50815.1 peptidase S8 and S53 subtilisin kexin sedolisin [Thermaerobacter marianensis DSM 12885]